MVGIDIIEVSRINKSLQSPNFLSKILTEQEINYISRYKDKVEHIAGFFCAKEAVMKALEDCKNISFQDIAICHRQTGKPYVKLYGKAKEVFDNTKCKSIEISISQSHTVATAICVISE